MPTWKVSGARACHFFWNKNYIISEDYYDVYFYYKKVSGARACRKFSKVSTLLYDWEWFKCTKALTFENLNVYVHFENLYVYVEFTYTYTFSKCTYVYSGADSCAEVYQGPDFWEFKRMFWEFVRIRVRILRRWSWSLEQDGVDRPQRLH
jgi:hypothetical protein